MREIIEEDSGCGSEACRFLCKEFISQVNYRPKREPRAIKTNLYS